RTAAKARRGKLVVKQEQGLDQIGLPSGGEVVDGNVLRGGGSNLGGDGESGDALGEVGENGDAVGEVGESGDILGRDTGIGSHASVVRVGATTPAGAGTRGLAKRLLP